MLYSVNGQWNDSFTIHKGGKKDGTVIDTYNPANSPVTPLTLAPLDQQDPRESKRAWKKVADAILKGDMDTTGAEKSKIEVAQREMRKREATEGKEWQRTFFTRVANDPLYDGLARVTGEKIDADKTNGIWRFDRERAKGVQKPY